jgi:hypothetical protein
MDLIAVVGTPVLSKQAVVLEQRYLDFVLA